MSQNSTTIFFCFLIPSTISSSGNIINKKPKSKALDDTMKLYWRLLITYRTGFSTSQYLDSEEGKPHQREQQEF
jgi:hypothetical protein